MDANASFEANSDISCPLRLEGNRSNVKPLVSLWMVANGLRALNTFTPSDYNPTVGHPPGLDIPPTPLEELWTWQRRRSRTQIDYVAVAGDVDGFATASSAPPRWGRSDRRPDYATINSFGQEVAAYRPPPTRRGWQLATDRELVKFRSTVQNEWQRLDTRTITGGGHFPIDLQSMQGTMECAIQASVYITANSRRQRAHAQLTNKVREAKQQYNQAVKEGISSEIHSAAEARKGSSSSQNGTGSQIAQTGGGTCKGYAYNSYAPV